jgi:hypothetical protein
VLHATDWLSLLANHSTNIGVPTFFDKVFPNATIAAPSKGKGHDYGFSLDLFSGRLSLKAVKYTTSQEGQTKSGGINAQYNLRKVASMGPTIEVTMETVTPPRLTPAWPEFDGARAESPEVARVPHQQTS